MKKGGRLPRYTRLKRKGRNRVKTREVDVAYLDWIRSLPCLVRGQWWMPNTEEPHRCEGRTEAHHVKTRATGGGDRQTVPLCARAHAMGHTLGWQSFQRAFAIDLPSEAARLADTYTKEGRAA